MATKLTTGLTGLAVEAHPREKLKILYAGILEALSPMPKTAAYRKYTEKITQKNLEIVEKTADLEQLEKALNAGQLEEVIEITKKELKLARHMSMWKPWDPLISQPPESQWTWP